MKALFVGGHWHGRVVEIPDGMWAYRVPVPVSFQPGSPAFAFGVDVEPEIQTYERETFSYGAGAVKVFAFGPVDEVSYVVDALAIAAGLDVRR